MLVEGVGGASEVTPEFTLGFGTDPDPALVRQTGAVTALGVPVCPFREFLEQEENCLSWPNVQQHWVMG